MTTADEKELAKIKKRFKACADNESESRREWLDDMRFTHVPGSQWPDDLRRLRDDPTSPRPCLEINVTAQHVYQVTNDIRQNRPTIKVRPVSMNASNDVAEVFNGMIRHIDACSDAEIAEGVASNAAVTAGWGYFRIVTEYLDKETNEQEIYIRPIYNTLSAYIDDNALCPVGSDANDGFVIEDIPRDQFEAEYGEEDTTGKWDESGVGEMAGWVTKDTIRVAEYFKKVEQKTNVLVLMNGQEIDEAKYWGKHQGDVMRPPVISNKTVTKTVMQWRKVTSFKILEEGEFPSKWVPIIRVPGIFVDIEGKRYWKGLTRDAKDPQRSYNYWWSTFTETVALQPKVPWLVAEGQIDGYESEWNRANISNQQYLTYRITDDNGNPLPAPTRQQLQGVPQGIMQGLMLAADAVKMVTGQYNASMGQQSNETSGKAIVARQREGDVATYHFPDNLAMAIRHKGRILIDMIPRVYDTKRVARTLGEDAKTGEARIDPTQASAVRETQQSNGAIEKIYNLGVGKYDVIATVGPSYTTKRQEAVDAMSTLMQGNPQLLQIAGDIFFSANDWPGADRIADRWKLMLPPPIQQAEQAKNGEQPIPPQVQAQMEQMQQQMQQMGQMMQATQAELQKLQAEKQAKAADIELKKMDVEIKKMEVRIKQIEAGVKAAELDQKTEQAMMTAMQPVQQQQPVPAQ